MTDINRYVVLRARPDPEVTADLFETVEVPMPDPGPGEMLIRVIWLSIDPAMRGWIASAANYQQPVPIGAPMTSFTVGEIIASNHPDYDVGEIVQGRQGWRSYAISDGSDIDRKVDPAEAPISMALHVLGVNGMTAHVGLLSICDPQPGQTVVVTTAAGAVGSVVGQLAKIRGCRTVGVTGSEEKRQACLEEFGYDVAINYKTSDDLSTAIAEACPDGVNAFFDNVAGDQFDAVIPHIAQGARIAICGTIGMPSFPIPEGPRPHRHLLINRARLEGFLVLDHYDRVDEIIEDLSVWYSEGKLKVREDVSEGIDTAPAALVRLLAGENQGKQLVRVSPYPA